MAILDDNLLGPVIEHCVSVLHPSRHRRSQDLQGLSDHAPGFGGVRFEQAVENLKDDPFVDGELGDDVGQEEVAVVPGRRVHAVLVLKTRPSVCHQATKLVTLLLVSYCEKAELTIIILERLV